LFLAVHLLWKRFGFFAKAFVKVYEADYGAYNRSSALREELRSAGRAGALRSAQMDGCSPWDLLSILKEFAR
jgi:hypothetical protein